MLPLGVGLGGGNCHPQLVADPQGGGLLHAQAVVEQGRGSVPGRRRRHDGQSAAAARLDERNRNGDAGKWKNVLAGGGCAWRAAQSKRRAGKEAVVTRQGLRAETQADRNGAAAQKIPGQQCQQQRGEEAAEDQGQERAERGRAGRGENSRRLGGVGRIAVAFAGADRQALDGAAIGGLKQRRPHTDAGSRSG